MVKWLIQTDPNKYMRSIIKFTYDYHISTNIWCLVYLLIYCLIIVATRNIYIFNIQIIDPHSILSDSQIISISVVIQTEHLNLNGP